MRSSTDTLHMLRIDRDTAYNTRQMPLSTLGHFSTSRKANQVCMFSIDEHCQISGLTLSAIGSHTTSYLV